MSDVSFNEEPQSARPVSTQSGGGLSGWLIQKGYAKDQDSANIMLLVCAVLALGIAGFLLFSGPKDQKLDANERAQLEASTRPPVR